MIKGQRRSQLYGLKGLMITFDATIIKLKKRDIRHQKRFDEADLVSYSLISIYSDIVDCDRVALGDNSSKIGIRELAISSCRVTW